MAFCYPPLLVVVVVLVSTVKIARDLTVLKRWYSPSARSNDVRFVVVFGVGVTVQAMADVFQPYKGADKTLTIVQPLRTSSRSH